jgi:hypothetical protein
MRYAKNIFYIETLKKGKWKRCSKPTHSRFQADESFKGTEKMHKKIRLVNSDEFGNRVLKIS